MNANAAPETRKLKIGDAVQLKGGTGPKMIVNNIIGDTIVECVYWDKDAPCFVQPRLSCDALAYLGDPAPLQPNDNQIRPPRTVSAGTLSLAIRNGRTLIDRRADWATVHQCFEALADEIYAQTGVNA